MTIVAATKGVAVTMLLVLLIGPPVVYQLINAAAATLLWAITKDWNNET